MNLNMPMLLVILLLTLSPWSAAQELTADSSPCFNRVVQPGGWQIPQHSNKAIRSGEFTDAGVPNLTFTTYAVSDTFFLPHYYVERGALVLVSLRFRTSELKRLEVNGQPFAFIAAVRGVDVGTAGSVWWLDTDGNGTFEEFSWNPSFSKLPDWVRARASTVRR